MTRQKYLLHMEDFYYSNCYLWYSNHYTIEEKEKNQLTNTKNNCESYKFENSAPS